MKEIKLYRESNGQYSTSEARQDDVSGYYVQKTDYDELRVEHYDERAKVQELLKENAELRYQIEKYESVLCGTCRGAGTVLISIDDGMDCPECTMKQEIGVTFTGVLTAEGSKYANKLRGEEE